MVRLFAFILVLLAANASADQKRTYLSPDKALNALVIPVGKTTTVRSESRIEIRDSGGKILLTRSFASRDGEHGYFMHRAAWTADSQFFVFSLSSSGGHQPWNSPIYFYCRSDRRLRLFDDYFGPITDPDFKLAAPDFIQASILKAYGDLEQASVKAKLSDLVKQKSKR
jgi:hypothetical protein